MLTDSQIEYAARKLCEMNGYEPDDEPGTGVTSFNYFKIMVMGALQHDDEDIQQAINLAKEAG